MIAGCLVAARFAHYVALALALGAASFAAPAWPRSPRWRQRLLRAASVGAFASALAVLGLTAAGLTGEIADAVDAVALGTILTETDFGRVWALRLLLAAALVAVAFGPRAAPASRWRPRVEVALAGGLLATLALTGHAQLGEGLPGLVHRAGDAAHLLAAGVWLGALPVFLHLLRPACRPVPDVATAREAARRLQRFHAVGTAAVAALVASGLVSSWFLVGEPARLFDTAYGRVLLAKLALFAGMLALAADNRWRLVPRLDRALRDGPAADGRAAAAWIARLHGRIRAELALGVGVLLAASLLGTLAPAARVAGP